MDRRELSADGDAGATQQTLIAMALTLSLIIGIVAGLRTVTPPAAVSWAARLGWLNLSQTPLAFLGYAFTPWILTVLALGELRQRQASDDAQPQAAGAVRRTNHVGRPLRRRRRRGQRGARHRGIRGHRWRRDRDVRRARVSRAAGGGVPQRPSGGPHRRRSDDRRCRARRARVVTTPSVVGSDGSATSARPVTPSNGAVSASRVCITARAVVGYGPANAVMRSMTQNIATAPIAYAGTASAQRGHVLGTFVSRKNIDTFVICTPRERLQSDTFDQSAAKRQISSRTMRVLIGYASRFGRHGTSRCGWIKARREAWRRSRRRFRRCWWLLRPFMTDAPHADARARTTFTAIWDAQRCGTGRRGAV